ncbi:MAG TPA: DUF3311 domain-containing protein [Trebonia sp.]|jgi:hypothetical protein
MVKSLALGFIPYIVMVIGIPFFNKSVNVGGIPLLGLWIGIWVVLVPVFLTLAARLLPRAEREDQL